MSQIGGYAKTPAAGEREIPAPKNPDSYRRRRRQQRGDTPHQSQSERDKTVAGNEVRGFVSQSEIEIMSAGNYRRFDG